MTVPPFERNNIKAHAIVIKDGDIYMAGDFYNDMMDIQTACFWKNGKMYLLNEDGTYSTSLFVY